MNRCHDCHRKEQELEHLRKELRPLKTMVFQVEREIRRAAKKYLPDERPLRLPLRSFVDLLLASSRQQGFKDAVLHLTEEHIEEFIRKALPDLKTRMQEVFSIPVLVKVTDKPIMKYAATPLRGGGKGARGATPEEAYDMVKGNIAVALAEKPHLLASLRNDLVGEFQRGRDLKTDEIMGFKVTVRVARGVA